MRLKDSLKRAPAVGPLLVTLRRELLRRRFAGSAAYWQARYDDGGNSGAGSYGRVAMHKAKFLNDFVRNNEITSVIEFGCGDGAQLSLSDYPTYVGLDVARSAIEKCSRAHGHDRTKSFFLYEPPYFINNGALCAEIALSLDVILHLVEDDILKVYLHDLSRAASRFIVIFTEDQKVSPPAAHVRYRNVADWLPALEGWKLAYSAPGPQGDPDTNADFFVFEPTNGGTMAK